MSEVAHSLLSSEFEDSDWLNIDLTIPSPVDMLVAASLPWEEDDRLTKKRSEALPRYRNLSSVRQRQASMNLDSDQYSHCLRLQWCQLSEDRLEIFHHWTNLKTSFKSKTVEIRMFVAHGSVSSPELQVAMKFWYFADFNSLTLMNFKIT